MRTSLLLLVAGVVAVSGVQGRRMPWVFQPVIESEATLNDDIGRRQRRPPSRLRRQQCLSLPVTASVIGVKSA